MVDRFVQGEILRISPEAPVFVLIAGEVKSTLWGAGNVVRNILALNFGVSFVERCGKIKGNWLVSVGAKN